MSVYRTTVQSAGSSVDAFGGEMMILFGENAPDTLKDFCSGIDVVPIEKKIETGMSISYDGVPYKILAVGDLAERNLVSLGHLTVNFTGTPDECLPGAIVVEKKDSTDMKIGTVIEINE